MPNQQATRLHFLILTMLFFMVFVMCVSEILLYKQVNNNPQSKVQTEHMDQYLKSSARFEIIFAIGAILEILTSMFAGKLIILYSEDPKSNLLLDPITGLSVPSLIFVYN